MYVGRYLLYIHVVYIYLYVQATKKTGYDVP